MSKAKSSLSSKKRKAKSAPRKDTAENSESKVQSRVRELEDKLSKGKSPKEIRISIDLIAKSDSKAFCCLLANSKKRVVIQLWTESWKLDEIFKKKMIKASKHLEHFILPDEKPSENMLSLDLFETINVAKGFKALLCLTKSLRFLHLVGIRFSQEAWEQLGDGITNNKSLYKLSINRCPMKPENMQAFSQSLGKHEFIETIDLSANGIEDDCGALIAGIIK